MKKIRILIGLLATLVIATLIVRGGGFSSIPHLFWDNCPQRTIFRAAICLLSFSLLAGLVYSLTKKMAAAIAQQLLAIVRIIFIGIGYLTVTVGLIFISVCFAGGISWANGWRLFITLTRLG